MKNGFSVVFAALLLATPALARPALWKLADADTTIWLFGTIHVLPAGYKWRDPQIDAAMGRSQELMLEVVVDQDPAQIAAALMKLGTAEGLPPLAERVPAGKRAALAALVKRSGIPVATLDRFKTWAAAVMLTGAALDQIGLKGGADGVDPELTRLFRAAGKPIEGLETAELQLGFFDALPEASQRDFLVATLDDPATSRADFQRMVGAWAKGDAAAIERAFADEPEFTPALREQLIRRRDANWAVILAQRLEKPGTLFVAVGAGHLVGPDSVQRMLAAKGMKVERVR